MKETKFALRLLLDKVYIQLYYFGVFWILCNLKLYGQQLVRHGKSQVYR